MAEAGSLWSPIGGSQLRITASLEDVIQGVSNSKYLINYVERVTVRANI
jgi:hypothetical protein